MDENKEYTVEVGGMEHTFLLNDDDAKRYDAKRVAAKAATPANKSRTPENKAK